MQAFTGSVFDNMEKGDFDKLYNKLSEKSRKEEIQRTIKLMLNESSFTEDEKQEIKEVLKSAKKKELKDFLYNVNKMYEDNEESEDNKDSDDEVEKEEEHEEPGDVVPSPQKDEKKGPSVEEELGQILLEQNKEPIRRAKNALELVNIPTKKDFLQRLSDKFDLSSYDAAKKEPWNNKPAPEKKEFIANFAKDKKKAALKEACTAIVSSLLIVYLAKAVEAS